MYGRCLLVLAASAAIGLAGCGGDSDDGGEETAASTPAPAATTETPTTETPTETTETPEAPAAAGKATPGGTTLAIGEPAVIDYEDSTKGKKTLIEVTPEAIEEGSLDDFANIDLDAAQKKSTPYYVKVAVKNVGKGDLSGSEPGSYIDAVDDRGQQQNEIIFFGDFDRCEEADPKKFAPGDSYETCLTFLIPGGGSIEGMRWIMFDEKNGKSDINWE